MGSRLSFRCIFLTYLRLKTPPPGFELIGVLGPRLGQKLIQLSAVDQVLRATLMSKEKMWLIYHIQLHSLMCTEYFAIVVVKRELLWITFITVNIVQLFPEDRSNSSKSKEIITCWCTVWITHMNNRPHHYQLKATIKRSINSMAIA